MTDWNWIITNKIVHRRRYAATHVHEPKVLSVIKQFHGDLFVDVGCNKGLYSKLAKKNFKKVIGIDPNPKWNADLQVALSNFNGTAPFYIGDNKGSADSLIHIPHIQGIDWRNNTEYDVKVCTFDSLELDADLVKIDVEEAEFQVLEGMQKYLPRNVIVELHDERRQEELFKLMSSKGYRLERLVDSTHWWFKL